MPKLLKYFAKHLLIIVIIAVFIFLVVCNIQSHSKKAESPDMILPDISMLDFEGNMFELNRNHQANATIILFFSPDCEHCEEIINEILDNKSMFEENDIRLLFITIDVLKDELKLFLEKYPIYKISNAFILLDKGLHYHELFEVMGSPTAFLFNKSQRLDFKLDGKFDLKIVEQWIGPQK